MPESSLREQPTLTTDDAKIELTEQELSRITGGRGKSSENLPYFRITMKEAIISSYSSE
jgi:bacteriocin-like protein